MQEKKQYIIVANWKMYLNFHESVLFCTTNKSALITLAKKQKIIFLPSFIALHAVSNALQNISMFFGAQNCSEFDSGAYTGETSAAMLADLGCSYCLVGHYERRIYAQETDTQIAKKLHRLLDVGITPILCVGEQRQENSSEKTKYILEQQLSVLENIPHNKTFLIAYEPSWAIGKNTVMFDEKQIEHIREIAQFLVSSLNSFGQVKLLYGGSINQHSIQSLLNIQEFDGFLIGKTSTNFSEFQKIIQQLGNFRKNQSN